MFSANSSQVSSDANYIEDIFQTWLYTGNGSTQTITNGIDLSTKGGMVWIKNRATATFNNHYLFDTARGVSNYISSNLTDAQGANNGVSAFNSNGFDLGAGNRTNQNTISYASWTFRKQPKFFDVATGTVNAGGGITINHSLGATPGFVILKDTTAAQNWWVWHRSYGANDQYQFLNTTAAQATFGSPNTWVISSTQVGITDGSTGGPFTPGDSYVAYVFAHNAGGFGLTGTDNVISCGSFTTDGSGNATVNLGYEPQFLIDKNSSSTGNWFVTDIMRGMSVTSFGYVIANTTAAESAGAAQVYVPTSTGFQVVGFTAGVTHIYIAIRRGPMKVPTSGTSVFSPVATTTNNTITTNFPVDLSIFKADKTTTSSNLVFDRLRGNTARLVTSTTGAEATATAYPLFDNNTGTAITGFSAGLSGIDWAFRRAPSFFDEVCYTGTGANAQTLNHNLGVAPELMFVKRRNAASIDGWIVYSKTLGTGSVLVLNTTGGDIGSNVYFGDTSPTATQFTVGYPSYSTTDVNASGSTYVAYLFATCAGVSKVGSYTGTGTTLQVNCGFTGGARFVMIKRTNSTGDWYVWDSARGIVAGNDPYLLMNSSAAEVTSTDYIDPYSAGFEISSTAPAAINASGGTFIFLAIA